MVKIGTNTLIKTVGNKVNKDFPGHHKYRLKDFNTETTQLITNQNTNKHQGNGDKCQLF